jgi:hypothetical protein
VLRSRREERLPDVIPQGECGTTSNGIIQLTRVSHSMRCVILSPKECTAVRELAQPENEFIEPDSLYVTCCRLP